MSCEKRKYMRHPFQVPLQLKRIDAVRKGQMSTSDMSPGGLQFLSHERFDEGAQLELSFPVKDQRFCLHGKIAYCIQDRLTGLYKAGLEFLNATEAFRAKLAEEILEIEIFRGKMARQLERDVSEAEASELWVRERAKRFSEIYG